MKSSGSINSTLASENMAPAALSSAITANLALEQDLKTACSNAKEIYKNLA
jgi:hydroxymethylpyrimidine/phosphomethylpyrimidine kinase